MKISESELILNADNSIYHLALQPEDIGDTIFVVGDPDRVPLVSHYFDSIELRKQKREFITHTGTLRNKRVTVMSTGISTDNIDIAINELDALANIDFKTRSVNKQLKSLKIIRIGTSGGLQPDIELGSSVVSTFGVGLDGLANYYQLPNNAAEQSLRKAFIEHFDANPIITNAYIATAAPTLVKTLQTACRPGITVTCGGFYGPQGRTLRAQPAIGNFVETLQSFSWQDHSISNFEMETAAIYAMGTLLGHECCSVNTIIANRCTKQFVSDPYKAVDKTIQLVLEKICS